MTVSEFSRQVKDNLPYSPNSQQGAVIDALARFLAGVKSSPERPAGPSTHPTFIVNGYAGTGKTSIVGALVKALRQLEINTVLMAPTGRAAKILADYADMAASTIHRRIYRHSINGEVPALKINSDRDTVYIVDEASMIADAASGQPLLEDLLQYVFTSDNPRLVLVGDTAQLPPVGVADSPAMDPGRLRELGLRVTRATLTKVARQGARSGILANAVNIRRTMDTDPFSIPKIITAPFSDVTAVSAEDLPEVIYRCYRRDGINETVIITRSNQRAALFNRAIRGEVLYLEEELTRGEPLMVLKNNYFWSRKVKNLDFIANGDTLIVEKILGTETRHYSRFADVILAVPDTDITFEAKIYLDTLVSPDAAVPAEKRRQLADSILRQHPGYDPAKVGSILASDPYWQALQVKFAYAVTCHKAQGGQWLNAIVDIAYVNPDTVGPEFHRWMYTAVTRARNSLTFLTDQPE